MKSLILQFGRLRLAAMIVTAAPLVVLPIMGALWLWDAGWLWWWLLVLLICGINGFLLHKMAISRDQQRLPEHVTQPNPHWAPRSEDCWSAIEKRAAAARIQDWPLNDAARLWQLAKEILEQVAHHYHPKREQPLLELTLPHALTIIERAARELRQDMLEHLPFSHRLTLGMLSRAKHWQELFEQYENWYRVGRAVLSPQTALFAELRRAVSNEILDAGSERVQNWLLREYIRKVGFHAIDLYSGQVLLSDDLPTQGTTNASAKALEAAAQQASQREEPLHILLLGQPNAGKSSLINALFGELTAATDCLPDTTNALTPYQLTLDGQTQALIFDSPGSTQPLSATPALKQAALTADLILWVTAANRADRDSELQQLKQLRTWLSEPSRRSPPLLIVATHIDQLRPVREWRPPYDLNNPGSPKAHQIREAIAAIATGLDQAPDRVIPVCLAEGRIYNVEDALWAAILSHEDEARRVRFLRCLKTRQQQENWQLIWNQLGSTGRLLLSLPQRLTGR
jgi:predicted GTPase